MKIGVVYFFTDDGPNPVKFAQQAEGIGFESIFAPEHSHFPVTRKSPYPARYGGGDLPNFYLHTHDAIVTLSFIAASTSTIKVGTGITLLAQHDAIWTAKEIATLDVLSGGRVICGVGWGWNQDEAEAHGVVWKDRIDVVADQVAIMRSLWRDEVASYDGKFVSLAPSWSWPKPAQAGGPPIYLGGSGPRSMKEAALWADTWYVVPPPDDPTLEVSIPKFRQICEDNGRDPATIGIAVASAPPDAAILEKYIEQGVERAALWVNPAVGDEGYRNLDEVGAVFTSMQG